MTVKLTHKHSKVKMIVKITRVNVCVDTFIANASLLIYKRFLNIWNMECTRLWRAGIFFQKYVLFVFHVNNIRARQNTRIWRTEPISIRKSSTKTKPKLIKYPNYLKFWFLENRIRSEPKYSGYPNLSEIDLYTYVY